MSTGQRRGTSGLWAAGTAAGLKGRKGQPLVGIMADVVAGRTRPDLPGSVGGGTGQARRGQIIGVTFMAAEISKVMRSACCGLWQ